MVNQVFADNAAWFGVIAWPAGGHLIPLYLSENERFSTLVFNLSDSVPCVFWTPRINLYTHIVQVAPLGSLAT